MSSSTAAFTNRDKLAAVQREIMFRRKVYGRKVDAKTMTQEQRDRGIAVMQAIEADYAKLVEQEDQATRLI